MVAPPPLNGVEFEIELLLSVMVALVPPFIEMDGLQMLYWLMLVEAAGLKIETPPSKL